MADMYSNFDQTAVIRKKTIRGVVIALIVLIVALALVWFMSHGRLSVTLPNDEKTYAVEVVKQETGEKVSLDSTTSDTLSKTLSAGNYEVRVFSDDDRATTQFVHVGRFLTNTAMTASLQNQSSRQKLARNVADCAVKSGNQLYSYTCGWSDFLTKHNPTTAKNYAQASNILMPITLDVQNYQDGLLALRLVREDDHKPLVPTLSIVKNGKITGSKRLPNAYLNPNEKTVTYLLITDRDQSANFAVARIEKEKGIDILLYKGLNTNPTVITPDIQTPLPDNLASSLDMYGQRVLFAYGIGSGDHELSETSGEAPETVLMTIEPGSTTSSTKTLPVLLSQASWCGASRICIYDGAKLQVYTSTYEKDLVLPAVDAVMPQANTSIVYQRDNALYNLDLSSRASNLLFSSPLFTIGSLFPARDGVLANTYYKGTQSPSATHTFFVSLTPAESTVFLDAVLPYSNQTDPAITDMDYAGKNVRITILLDSAMVDIRNGKVHYDQDDFNTVTSRIMDRLAKDGITKANYIISFTVSY